ncbi:MAG: hypothetical protein ABIU05_05180 [Nitrospirales bacterium]
MNAATSNGHPDSFDASQLSRGSVGLTPAHRELIRLLAQIAVENYLSECDAPPEIGGEA